MNEAVPMSRMFRACAKVLETRLVPMHYGELTVAALDLLGVPVATVDLRRQIEDVREKMLCAGQMGTAYMPKPDCLALKSHWFKSHQMDLLNPDCIRVPGSASAGVRGTFEALMRAPHMMQKNIYARQDARLNALATGIQTEHHFTDWFCREWPQFYRHPDNYQQWERPCAHDFKICMGERCFLVDVWGQAANGTYRAPPGKRQVQFHLQCRIDGPSVVWESVVNGPEFRDGVLPVSAKSPVRMVVWLNCAKHGLDYNRIASFMAQGVAA